MKILMLTPYLPYPDSSGGQIRTQNLLRHLKKKHDITLFSLIKDPKEEKYVPILKKNFCKDVKVFYRPPRPWMLSTILRTGFSTYPFLVVRNFSQSAQDAIKQELKTGKYDLIHVETFYAMPHIPANTTVPVVLVDQTIEYKVYQHYVNQTAPFFLKPLMQLDVYKLKYWERFYWRQANRVVAVSKSDRDQMLELEPNLKVDIVPNGVNLDFFKKKTSWKDISPILLFVGNFHWLQNTEAALLLIKQVLPLVKKQVSQTKVMIVGQHQPQDLKDLASDSVIIKDLSEDDSESIRQAYYHSSVFVTPLKGPGGTRLKNLAAMASQLPIVSSRVGITGLGVKNNQEVIIKDSPKAMAQAIIDLLKHPQKAEKLAKASRHYVESSFDYQVIAAKLSDIYEQVAQHK